VTSSWFFLSTLSDILFTNCTIGRFFKRALSRGGVYAAAAAAAGGVIIHLAKKKKLLPHVKYATKISAFYVAHKIVLAASLVPSSCKTRS